MVENCANPECSQPFDYREGRLYCCPMHLSDCRLPTNSHGVEHYWLCGSCAKTHTFKRQAGFGVLVTPRFTITPASRVKMEVLASRAA